jgi:hypothetical protein
LQWLQEPSEINGDNVNDIKCEASRHFRNKKGEYLKHKINECATNNKNKNIRDLYRGINDFKRGYQPRSKVVKDRNGDLLADSHSIVIRWKNYVSQLLNVQRVIDIRQIEIQCVQMKGIQNKIIISQEAFSIHIYGLHHEKVSIFFSEYITFSIHFNVGPFGGTTNIQTIFDHVPCCLKQVSCYHSHSIPFAGFQC